ncbi:MAG: peptidylprolyl isomerase [Rhodospirillales bacterium]|nr:peptidylprolyl isomerase [Rhodospirillales bacterium]
MRKFALAAAAAALSAALALPQLSTAAKAADDPVVAVVNGYEIFMSDIMNRRQQLGPQAQQYPMQLLFNLILQDMIAVRLVADEARKQGYDKESQVRRAVSQIEDQILQRELMSRYVKDNMTDDAVKARYDQFLKENPPLDEVRARHILVETEEQARAVIVRVGKGEDFGRLARELSTGPSGKVGGDLGYFTREKMVPEFSAAAFGLRPGDVTRSPVKTQFGWHVIKVEDRRTQEAPSYAQAEGQMREQVEEQLTRKYVSELREKAKVETFGPEGRPDPK